MSVDTKGDRQPHRDLAALRRLLKASPGKMTRTALAEHDARVRAEALEEAAVFVETQRGGFTRNEVDLLHALARELRRLAPAPTEPPSEHASNTATGKQAGEATDPAGRPASVHSATCAGCSWCSPAYAAQRASEPKPATCGCDPDRPSSACAAEGLWHEADKRGGW